LGVYTTYKLEELYPAPKPQPVGPSNVIPKSKVDLLILEDDSGDLDLERDEDLKKLV
jgi:hypothetical protein